MALGGITLKQKLTFVAWPPLLASTKSGEIPFAPWTVRCFCYAFSRSHVGGSGGRDLAQLDLQILLMEAGRLALLFVLSSATPEIKIKC